MARSRLTQAELEALCQACGFVLAGDADEWMGEDAGDALRSAHRKLSERIKVASR